MSPKGEASYKTIKKQRAENKNMLKVASNITFEPI